MPHSLLSHFGYQIVFYEKPRLKCQPRAGERALPPSAAATLGSITGWLAERYWPVKLPTTP